MKIPNSLLKVAASFCWSILLCERDVLKALMNMAVASVTPIYYMTSKFVKGYQITNVLSDC